MPSFSYLNLSIWWKGRTSTRSTLPRPAASFAAMASSSRRASLRARSGDSQQLAGMARDHQLFVGRDHPGGHGAPRVGNARPPGGVPPRVDLDAEPGGGRADARADLRGVLADAGGEDQRVDAAEHSGQRPDLLGRAVDEVVQRE